MGQYFFDVFDGTRAVTDDFGDVFAGVDEAADLAAGLLADFAREAAPAGLSRDYGVIVRDERDRDVYRAVLSFRAAFLDGRAPPDHAPAPPLPDPVDLIRQSRETRATSRDLARRHRLLTVDWLEVLERMHAASPARPSAA